MTTAESDAGMAVVAEIPSQHERRRTIGVRLLPSGPAKTQPSDANAGWHTLSARTVASENAAIVCPPGTGVFTSKSSNQLASSAVFLVFMIDGGRAPGIR